MADEPERAHMRLDPTITTGDVVKAGAGIIAVVVWAVVSVNNSTQTSKDLGHFQDQVGRQFGDLNAKVDTLSDKIAALPVDRVQVVQLSRRVDQVEADNKDQGARIVTLEKANVGLQGDLGYLKADVAGLKAASGQSSTRR